MLIRASSGSGGGGGSVGDIKASDTIHVSSNAETITIDTGLGNALSEFCLFGLSPKKGTLSGIELGLFAYWNSSLSGYQNCAITLGNDTAGGKNRAVAQTQDSRAPSIMSVTSGVVTIQSSSDGYMLGNDYTWVAI